MCWGRGRKGHGDAPRAAPRLRWGAAAPAENCKQRNLTGGPGVPWTPGRRPPHRNGGTFGSFSHERTTIIRLVVKKMAAKLSRQVSCTATPAKANKEKNSVRGAAECGVSRGVGDAGRPVRPILAAWAAGGGCGVPRRVTAPGRPRRVTHPIILPKNVKLSSKKTTQNRQRVNKESKKGKFSL